MAAKKNEVQKILEVVGDFVTKQGGAWEHADWESFLKKADKIGISMDDEGKRHLGNLLEAAKLLYHKAGITPEPKSAKAKAKAKAKAAAAQDKPAKKKASARKSTVKKGEK